MLRYCKSIFCILLCFVFIMAAAGCGKAGEPGGNGGSDNSNKSELDIAAEEIAQRFKDVPEIAGGKKVKIKVFMGELTPSLNETPTAENPDVINTPEIIKRAFELIHPNVQVEWVRNADTSDPDMYLQYLITQLNAKTAPDILFAWGSSFSERDWYYDFTEDLKKPNPYVSGNKAWREQFPDYLFSSLRVSDVKDRVVGIPINLSPGTATALYLNKSIFDELNLSYPKTWEDLFNASNKIAEAGYISFSPWGNPGGGNRKITPNVWDVQFSLGPYYAAAQADKFDYNKDGVQSQSEKIRAAYEGHYMIGPNDYAKDLWRQVKRKYNEILQEGFENIDYETKWMLGKVAILEDGLWRYPDELSNTERDFDFVMIPPPAVSTDTSKYVKNLEYTEKGPYRPAPGLTLNILMPSVKDHGDGVLEACIAFLKFLTEPENNNMINLEQKGKCISFMQGAKIPQELNDYFSQSFPKIPQFEWGGGFTTAGNEKMSKILELWVKNRISDQEFYRQYDDEAKKDIESYIKTLGIDTTGWKKGW